MSHVNDSFQVCLGTYLEGAEALSYLVSCRLETGASHPGLATDTAEYYFPESWEVWGFRGLESVGSYQVWGAKERWGKCNNQKIC